MYLEVFSLFSKPQSKSFCSYYRACLKIIFNNFLMCAFIHDMHSKCDGNSVGHIINDLTNDWSLEFFENMMKVLDPQDQHYLPVLTMFIFLSRVLSSFSFTYPNPTCLEEGGF